MTNICCKTNFCILDTLILYFIYIFVLVIKQQLKDNMATLNIFPGIYILFLL